MEQTDVLSPAMTVYSLLKLLTEELLASSSLRTDLPVRAQFMEVVLDAGRRPFAWVKEERHSFIEICDYKLTSEQLMPVVQTLWSGQLRRRQWFASQNLSNPKPRGACGRNALSPTVRPCTEPTPAFSLPVYLVRSRDIFHPRQTSFTRDVVRLLADKHSIVIVDTSCEIGGKGDILNECFRVSRCR
jgi:hypothetical protein